MIRWTRLALLGGTARAIFARALSILSSFLLTILVARLLGVEAAGSFFLAFTTLAVVATFGRFGTDNLALKICGGEPERIRTELGYSATIAAIAGVSGAGLIYLLLLLSHFILPGMAVEWIPLVLSAAIPQAFAVIAGSVLRGRGRLGLGIIAELGSIPTLSIVFLLILRAAGLLSLTSALISLVAASWLTALWAVIFAVATIGKVSEMAPRSDVLNFRSFFGSRFRQLSSMMGTSLLFYILTWAPLYALSIASSLVNVSYYTTAARFANIVALVPAIQVAYLSPAFARHFQRHEIGELNALAQRAVRQAALLLLIPVAMLLLAAPLIIRLLYGTAYAPAALPLAILSVGVFLVALAGQVNQLMLLCDLESHALVLSAFLVAIWATLGLWVASQFGATGVAWFGAAAGTLYAVSAAWLLASRRGIRSGLVLARPLRTA